MVWCDSRIALESQRRYPAFRREPQCQRKGIEPEFLVERTERRGWLAGRPTVVPHGLATPRVLRRRRPRVARDFLQLVVPNPARPAILACRLEMLVPQPRTVWKMQSGHEDERAILHVDVIEVSQTLCVLNTPADMEMGIVLRIRLLLVLAPSRVR